MTCRPHASLEANPCSSTPNLKKFSLLFDVDCEKVPLQLQTELIAVQSSEDLKSKFLACHTLDFYKNYGLLQPYHPHPVCREHIWHYITLWTIVMKYAKSMLRPQLSNLISSFYQSFHLTLILYPLWLRIASDVSLINYDCYLGNLVHPSESSFVSLGLKRLGSPGLKNNFIIYMQYYFFCFFGRLFVIYVRFRVLSQCTLLSIRVYSLWSTDWDPWVVFVFSLQLWTRQRWTLKTNKTNCSWGFRFISHYTHGKKSDSLSLTLMSIMRVWVVHLVNEITIYWL